MSALAEQSDTGLDPLCRFRQAVVEDLRTLALMHDRELDRDRILALWHDCYSEFLGVRLRGARGRKALDTLRGGLTDIPTSLDQQTLDILAAEYADIYLTHGMGASPCESVWLDEDHLAMQEPMFQVRDWYKRYGLAVEDWRQRTDDHLVNQLLFLAYLSDPDRTEDTMSDAARFMDEHLLRWIDRFAQRVGERCSTRLYAGLAQLTAAYLDELRDILAEVMDAPRPTIEETEVKMRPKMAVAVELPAPYVPGTGPSW